MNKAFPLNPFINVVASGVATCDLNSLLGSDLEAITLTLGGGAFTKAMITLLQIKANGKIIFESDGSKIDALETYKGYQTADATKLCINLLEMKTRTLNAFVAGAWDLGPGSGIMSLRMEVTIAGATTPTLSGIAETNPATDTAAEAGIRMLLRRRHRATQTIGAAGTYTLQVPHLDPAGGGSVFQRIALFAANCTAIRTVRQGNVEYDLLKGELEFMQKKAGRIPQANLVVFDPILDGIQAGRVWDTRASSKVNHALFYGVFSAGETITIETEELIPLRLY